MVAVVSTLSIHQKYVYGVLVEIMFTYYYIYLIYTKISYIYLMQKAMCNTKKSFFNQVIY
jgi:hypothetical protein